MTLKTVYGRKRGTFIADERFRIFYELDLVPGTELYKDDVLGYFQLAPSLTDSKKWVIRKGIRA